MPAPEHHPDSFRVLASCFSLASFGGLSALLRSGKPLGWRSVASAMSYSGLLGLTIGYLWYTEMESRGNLYFLMGVSALAGLGGVTLADFLIQVIARGGVQIVVKPQEDPNASPEAGDKNAKG